jgi:hypothetical protein
VLWDTILANDIIDSSQSTDSYHLIFIDFLAVAMIGYIKEDRKKLNFKLKKSNFSFEKRPK